jgi:hypothetical protein
LRDGDVTAGHVKFEPANPSASSDWNSVTTSPEVAQAGQRRPFACELRNTDLQLWPGFQRRSWRGRADRITRIESHQDWSWELRSRLRRLFFFLFQRMKKGVEQLGVRVADNRAVSSGRHVCAVETGLAGWAYRTRTDESVGQLSDWNGDPARTSCVIRICSSVEISADGCLPAARRRRCA